ncbi:SGNH hydrolase domain-containing protein [Parafrigoribacterium mesophilum]|uniref:acyltransferase family protein n=1 Tax=Parafrigoribacterium mesophilum TaxID=433646 RepID=UPI0031FC05C4
MQNHRRDIQGLRAVAVLLVIANHFLGWPSGGFIGVDVFFVISGYLITGLLLREHERTGTISLAEFYRRRVRRILPAALAVTVTTLAVGFVVFTRSRSAALFTDGVWATLFGANWRFIITGTDYMHAGDAVSPLQHYWSLSIEEQFYFVWPLILLLTLAIAVPRHRRRAAVAIAVIGIASFGFAVWETSVYPTVAYFSTFSRIWELASGALLAISAPRVSAMSEAFRPFLAWGGLGVIAASALLINSETPFPGPFALAPIAGTAAIIAAGVDRRRPQPWLLTNRAANYVGDISYSLYLWHLPSFVIVGLFLASTPRRYQAAALVVTAALAVTTFHLVENPIRRTRHQVRIVRPALAVLCIVGCSVLVVNIAPRTSVAVAQGRVYRTGQSPALRALWKGIDAALMMKAWPKLTPSIDTIGADDKAPAWVSDGCLGHSTGALANPVANAKRCDYGSPSAQKLAVVLGDSVAISWVPGIRKALEPRGYRVVVLTMAECPVADVETYLGDGSAVPECSRFRHWALSYIQSLHPAVVVASDAASTITRLVSGAKGAASETEWETGMHRSLALIAEASERVVVLQSPPTGKGFDTCAILRSTPDACLLLRPPEDELTEKAERAAATGLPVDYVDTASWFCGPQGRCPSFVWDTPVLADRSHLTAAHSRNLSAVLADAILSPAMNGS